MRMDRLEQRNSLMYKRNEEVFNLYNNKQGQYNQLESKNFKLFLSIITLMSIRKGWRNKLTNNSSKEEFK